MRVISGITTAANTGIRPGTAPSTEKSGEQFSEVAVLTAEARFLWAILFPQLAFPESADEAISMLTMYRGFGLQPLERVLWAFLHLIIRDLLDLEDDLRAIASAPSVEWSTTVA